MAQNYAYQWNNITSADIEYNAQRVSEFLDFTALDPDKAIRQNYCLDVGCGNGCYSYSMQKLGAMRIDSIDKSPEAVARCKQVNPDAKVLDFMKSEKKLYPVYDFVLCCGALSLVQDPREGFRLLSRLIKSSGGYLHIMAFNKANQSDNKSGTKSWPEPSYIYAFGQEELKKWFGEEGFSDIRIISTHPININGKRGNPSKRDYGKL